MNKKYIGANQPYLFPYFGFFQLINSVDIFLLCGELQYIRHGWINRNRWIFPNENWRYFSFSVGKGSVQDAIIDKVYVNFEEDKKRFMKQMLSYKKSCNFEEAYTLFEDIMKYDNANVSDFNEYSIQEICKYLSIDTKIISSDKSMDILYKEKMINSERLERIFYICKYYDCQCYRNAIGGQGLYSKEEFKCNNIKLEFVKPLLDQRDTLSIVDYIMKHSRKESIERLKSIEIV